MSVLMIYQGGLERKSEEFLPASLYLKFFDMMCFYSFYDASLKNILERHRNKFTFEPPKCHGRA